MHTTTGRKARSPAALKLAGVKSRRKITNNGDIAKPGRPEVPSYIKDRQVAFYNAIVDELEQLGASSQAYQYVVSVLAIRLCDIEYLTQFVRDNGRSFRTENIGGGEMVRAYPEIAMLNEALRHVHSLVSELGLTPSAIGRLKGMKTANEKDDWDGL